MTKSIAIFGGAGFLGRKICETGVNLGWSVTSISRSGTPPNSQPWTKKVAWEKGDILLPPSYEDKIKSKTAVVHSIGLLFEGLDYKSRINTNFNFLNDLKGLSNQVKGPNPMEKSYEKSYEALQRDSAVLLADAYIKNLEKPVFVYISADGKPPVVPDGYLTTKREAEFELSCKSLRGIFMRPSFMFDKDEHGTGRDVLKGVVNLAHGVKSTVLGDSVSYINKLVRPAVSTDQVARAVFEKIEDETFSGVVTLEELQKK